jgi:hypothetical protein
MLPAMSTLVDRLLPHALWQRIQPLLPPAPARPRGGAWLGGWRRRRIRYERSSERFYALAMLACSVICFKALQQPPW